MAQPDGRYEFKWKEPDAFSESFNTYRTNDSRGMRAGIIEFSEKRVDGSVLDPRWIDPAFVKELCERHNFIDVGHSLYENQSMGEFLGQLNGPTRQVDPWCLCNDLEVVRDTRNKYVFHVNFRFGQPEGMDRVKYNQSFFAPPESLIDVPPSISLYPYVRRRAFQEAEKIMSERWVGTGQTGDRDTFRLPTGSKFAQPFRRQVPTKTYVQWQYEPWQENIEDVLEQRIFTINNDEFAGNTPLKGTPPDPNTGQDGDIWLSPPRWKIVAIEYQAVSLPIGDSIDYESAFLMRYVLEYTIRDGGWFERRSLQDKFFLRVENDLNTKTPNKDDSDQTTLVECLIKPDGTRLDDVDQGGPGLYKDYRVQPEISFGFLRDD